ncbi:MAG: glutamyl-tRNA reductase [Armatimonadota bacterium]
MYLVVIGLNHKTAPVAVRESLAVSDEDLPKALESLRACPSIAECCILSTCNRTEVYAVTNQRDDEETILDFMGSCNGNPRVGIEQHIYRHRGHKAVEHLFSVASGIDSMMVGENQIIGQVKNAFCAACDCDSTKTVLNTLFQQALSVGKRARTETDISKGAFSVGYAAVELARLVFGELSGRTVLIIGAGKMGELTAKHMQAAGATSVIVANRTLSKAEKLAAALNGRAVPFESLPDAMTQTNIVISSTGATEPVVSREEMAKIMRGRRERPIFMIDIAVPRDIEPSVSELDNVYLYDMDDLQSIVQESVDERQKETEKVKEIVAEETRKFSAWMKTLEAVPLIKSLREKLDELKETEWQRSSAKLSHLSDKDKETVRMMMQSLVNKITHNPLVKIKEYSSCADSCEKLDIARELFGIEPDEMEDDK